LEATVVIQIEKYHLTSSSEEPAEARSVWVPDHRGLLNWDLLNIGY